MEEVVWHPMVHVHAHPDLLEQLAMKLVLKDSMVNNALSHATVGQVENVIM